jgi:NAD(P)-dependent dehydrogenase (short-subunit alcohol dehydrogenase family)
VVEEKRVLIAGGSGVFGRILAREILATTSVKLILAGRDREAAARACRSLDGGGRVEARAMDLDEPETFLRAAAGCFAVVCAAGPFQTLDRQLPRLAVASGAHWLDIGDDAGWVVPVLDDTVLDRAARAAGVAVLPGLSTVPALSGALARWCLRRASGAALVRIVLWIGNRNARGAGAIASALLSGFGNPVTVRLPGGERRAWLFRSPDLELLRRDPGIEAEFRVAFEWRISNWMMARLQGIPDRCVGPLAAGLSLLSAPFARLGSDEGCLQAEALDAGGGSLAAAAFLSRGQRLAILPAAIALAALCSEERAVAGVLGPGAWLSPEDWIDRVRGRGIEFLGRTESRTGARS